MPTIERRRFLTPGPAGDLEVLLEPCDERGVPGPTAVLCHPHPRGGGSLENKVVYSAARALRSAGWHTLRFNFRGVGKSGGEHDGEGAEKDDVRALLSLARESARADDPLLLLGYSFGAWMGLPVGEEDPRVTRLIGIGLPLDLREFSLSPVGQKPILVIQGTRDEFARTETARTWARARGASTELLLLETDHFFGEKLAEVEESVRGFARI